MRRTADQLARVGLRREHRVGLVMSHGSQAATASLALTSVATCVPLNPAYTEDELLGLLRRLRVSVVLMDEEQIPARRAARRLDLPVVPRARPFCSCWAPRTATRGRSSLRTTST